MNDVRDYVKAHVPDRLHPIVNAMVHSTDIVQVRPDGNFTVALIFRNHKHAPITAYTFGIAKRAPDDEHDTQRATSIALSRAVRRLAQEGLSSA